MLVLKFSHLMLLCSLAPVTIANASEDFYVDPPKTTLSETAPPQSFPATIVNEESPLLYFEGREPSSNTTVPEALPPLKTQLSAEKKLAEKL